jgi:hypothetical protein
VRRMFGREILGRGRCVSVHELLRRRVLGHGRGERVRDLPEQHVLRGGGVGVRRVPDERGVGGRECLAGVLLLPERVCACGGLVQLSDLCSGDVQQPARAHGVLKLLAWLVLGGLRGDRQRDVSRLSAWRMVARGQSELQPVPGELARCERERVANRVRLRRGVYWREWGHVHGVR